MAYNILIVDDSSIVRKVLRKTLGFCDFTLGDIHEAEHGGQALTLLEQETVDLVFLDINMPVMNGMEFMGRLRSDTRFVQLPVIIISTEGSRVRKAELADKDIKAYLRKPVTPETLTNAIEQIFGGKNDGFG